MSAEKIIILLLLVKCMRVCVWVGVGDLLMVVVVVACVSPTRSLERVQYCLFRPRGNMFFGTWISTHHPSFSTVSMRGIKLMMKSRKN